MSNMDAVLAGRLGVLSLEQKVRLLTGADFWSLWPEPVAPAAPTAPWPRDRVAAELRAGPSAGFVLARNADVDGAPALPLERTGLRRVAVLGPNAEAART